MRYKEFALLLEGGKMFSQATPFDQGIVKQVLQVVNNNLATLNIQVIPVGSGANPTPGKVSGDFDVMADEQQVADAFGAKDAKSARKALKDYLEKAGFATAQSGVNVHILVPMGGTNVQTDIMVVPNAAAVSRFHQHNMPASSPYKGVSKQILLSRIAKDKNMLWSPWQGLFKRDDAGKKADFITNDIDKIAALLLGKGSTAADLGSVESILEKTPNADELLTQLRTDPNWQEIKL
jgi:hypothetical protein